MPEMQRLEHKGKEERNSAENKYSVPEGGVCANITPIKTELEGT